MNKPFDINTIKQKATFSFKQAANLLDKYNSDNLWCISSQLSCIDFFEKLNQNNKNIFFPIIHHQFISMLCKAIIESKAKSYKTISFDLNKLSKLLNLLNNASYYDIPENYNNSDYINILILLSKIANSQFDFQNINFSHNLSRSYLQYYLIPNTEKAHLEQKHKSNYVDIPSNFNKKTGITINKYLTISFIIFAFYFKRYENYLTLKDNTLSQIFNDLEKSNSKQDYIFKVLLTLFKKLNTISNVFFITPDYLIDQNSKEINKSIINKYLTVVSRTSSQLGKMQYEPQYKNGDISQRLSPLERYPVVKISDEKFIVPNLSYFNTSIEKFIHFEMQELYPNNEFNETFGTVFEKYVSMYIQDRLKNEDYIFIPEISYKKNKGLFDGPDITLVFPNQKKIIAIEIKSKKFKLNTKLSPYSEYLKKDLDRIYTALKKLPEKIDDLYFKYPEYSKWQNEINRIPKTNIICVVVMSGSLHFLAELINIERKNDEKHFLNHYPYKDVIMPIEIFENALELTNQKTSDLCSILSRYYHDSLNLNPKQYAAQLLGGLNINNKDHFLTKYMDILFDDIELFKNQIL